MKNIIVLILKLLDHDDKIINLSNITNSNIIKILVLPWKSKHFYSAVERKRENIIR